MVKQSTEQLQRLVKSRKEIQDGFEKRNSYFALSHLTWPWGWNLCTYPGHGAYPPVPGARHRQHAVRLERVGLPGASGGATAADPATGALPECCAMGSSSLHSADDRALLRHGSILLGHRLRRQSDRGSSDRATHRR